MNLKTAQKRYLRGLAHHLKPVVMVADKGLTENVMTEINAALDRHELIKIKLRTDRDTRKSHIEAIGKDCKAELVNSIGQVACFFRRNQKDPVIALPGV